MELDVWSRPARGLHHYVRLVAEELGCSGDAFWVQTESPLHAYLPLEQRVFGFPDRDAALLWDERRGWSAAVEASGEEPLVISYLGGDPLPPPAAVARFATKLADGAGRAGSPATPLSPDVLVARLARYAPEPLRALAS